MTKKEDDIEQEIEEEEIVIEDKINPYRREDLMRCDPKTMNCEEMRDTIIKLTKEKAIIETGIEKLNDIKNIFPRKRSVVNLYKEAEEQKKEVDDKIYDLFENFTVCSTSKKGKHSNDKKL